MIKDLALRQKTLHCVGVAVLAMARQCGKTAAETRSDLVKAIGHDYEAYLTPAQKATLAE